MKRIITAALVGALLASAPAYAGSQKELAQSALIEVGNDKLTVLGIMKDPGNRELNGNQEAWQYCARSGAINKFVVVYFKDGKVEKMATYTKKWLGGCGGQYKPVKWDAPVDPREGLRGQ
ncbi:hypothetical protein [Asticcacaulis benevestitus]|uniref:Lipoprotein SmpA/OmlA domain-containing protein n=1 Tax=Asticcacaulis benevestitus DSM 16100 = ATCC BAA-896 TaxID=1121022 RepID=V4PAA5_9CAUL|nr:hypothetical protein [Asticcacaulis benevestitus]ESQ84991.1 hypothetical protein ABENE_19435 [Asticcacaulis benevestitus DSM 16100 = ATCC BAA-896]